MALGKLPVLGRPTIWMIEGQGPIALPFSPLPHSLWETARYRLQYCLKRAVKPNKQSITTDDFIILISAPVSRVIYCLLLVESFEVTRVFSAHKASRWYNTQVMSVRVRATFIENIGFKLYHYHCHHLEHQILF